MNPIDIDILFKHIIPLFESYYKSEIIIDHAILKECMMKIDEHLSSLKKPSEYKIAGCITFWLRKLKPFQFQLEEKDKNPSLFLNESITIIYGYVYIKAYKHESKQKFINLNKEYLADLATQLRYSSFSPSSIALLYQAIYLT